MPESQKPVLHKSQILTFSKCPRMWMYRYVEGIKRPPGGMAHRGTGVHKAAAKDLTNKKDHGVLLPLDELKETAKQAVNEAWDKEGVMLTDDDRLMGEKFLRGAMVDSAVRLETMHHKDLAPTLNPTGIERSFVVELRGYPADLGGTLDLEEPGCVRDLKCRSKSPNQGEADTSIDLTVYGLASAALNGKPGHPAFPGKLILDCLVMTQAQNPTLKIVNQETTRTAAAYQSLLARVELVTLAMQRGYEGRIASDLIADDKGIYPPTDPTNWWCHPSHCGYYDMCPFGSPARVQG